MAKPHESKTNEEKTMSLESEDLKIEDVLVVDKDTTPLQMIFTALEVVVTDNQAPSAMRLLIQNVTPKDEEGKVKFLAQLMRLKYASEIVLQTAQDAASRVG